MFGNKAASGRTVLLLDIESGSVGSALLNLSKQTGPYLYGYHRGHAPLELARSSDSLFNSFDKTLNHSLAHTAEVAARMRLSGTGLGDVAHVAVFLAAPWGMPNLEARKPTFAAGVVEHIRNALSGFFAAKTTSFHTSADALAFSTRTLSPDMLLAALRGEFIELLLFTGGKVGAYGTVPTGARSILRTLKTHGSLTEHEARSLVNLLSHGDQNYEPLVASGEHMRNEFFNGASLLLKHGSPSSIVVVGEHPLNDWFAQRIAEEERLVDLFSRDATVESLKQLHFDAPLSSSAVADPFILSAAEFIDRRASL